MHILTTSTENQDIKIKPRKSYVVGVITLTLIDKETRTSKDYTGSYSFSDSTNVMTITVDFDDLKAETYYTLVIKDTDGNLIAYNYKERVIEDEGIFEYNNRLNIFGEDNVEHVYRGLVYVTNQTDYPKYEVGKNDYTTEDSYDNEFVFID
jgi:hypothetical protein